MVHYAYRSNTEEADRFNSCMKARRHPHRARIDTERTAHFVIEPPLPPMLAGANTDRIRRGRQKRRRTLIANRAATTDPQTRRMLELMIDNHDRRTGRVRSHDSDQLD